MRLCLFDPMNRRLQWVLAAFAAVLAMGLSRPVGQAAAAKEPVWIRSKQSGVWSAPSTWEGGQLPRRGARVQIRPGHRVVYDMKSGAPIRFIHVAGTLTFAPDRDTRLDVGLIKIQAGDKATEDGFDCDAHLSAMDSALPKPALEVGTPNRPIDREHSALIRLTYLEGMNKETCPAIICCGGRLDLHGAPMSRTWVKLGADAKGTDDSLFRKPGGPAPSAKDGDKHITLEEPVRGWKPGDRIIITATSDSFGRQVQIKKGAYYVKGRATNTDERLIKSIDGNTITLDQALGHDHLGSGAFRAEVANLSRNVVIESADADGIRGHTMYHRNSAGSISYAEFRHLGKEGILGKYPIHYHLVGDTMRGSSVIGASIWDSGNRWLTIHGTNYLVVRDCVGYQSVGHGFFMEDGTEAYNVLDRNLAVQARRGRPLPKQVLPFDQNEGAGFWWANSLNTFTRNVACENERYGFRFEATKTSRLDLTLPVQQPNGTRQLVDIRTLPFVRFDNNEAHCDGLYGFNLGEGVARIGPDARHPFIIRNMKIWETHYAFRPQSPNVLVENMTIHRAAYGVYHPNYDGHVYRHMTISDTNEEPFNRGHDDDSVQYGVLTVDGLTFAGSRNSPIPLIQISDDNPTGRAESHFRNVRVVDRQDQNLRALVNLGGGPRPTPKTPKGVPIYIHDYYGPNRDAKIASIKARDLIHDGNDYRQEPPLTGDESRVAEVHDVPFPKLLSPVDDLPPTTVITHVGVVERGRVIVRGTTSDNGTIRRVLVNGKPARATAPNFAEWEVTLENMSEGIRVSAHAEDTAGNIETRPHVITLSNER